MMNRKYIILSAALLAALPLAGLSAQQQKQKQAAVQKPAYIKLNVHKDCNAIRDAQPKNDREAIDKAFFAYYEKNKDVAEPAHVRIILERLIENAAHLKDTTIADKYVKMLEATGRDMGNYTMWYVGGRFASAYTGALDYKFCERLFAAYKDRIDPMYRLDIIVKYAIPYRNPGRFDASVKLIDTLFEVKCNNPKNDPKVEEKFKTRLNASVCKIVRELVIFDYPKAIPLIKKYQHLFTDSDKAEVSLAAAYYAKCNNDRPLFDEMLAKLKALPDSDQKIGWLARMANMNRGNILQKKILDELLARKDLLPKRRFDLLEQSVSLPGTRNYGIHRRDAYPEWKQAKLQQIRLIDENPEIFKNQTWYYIGVYNHAWEYGDYKFADELRARVLKLNEKNPIVMWQQRVKEFVRLKKDKEASELIQLALESKHVNGNEKNNWKIFKYFLDGGTFDGFDKAFADRNFNSQKKMEEIRNRACVIFMECGRNEEARTISDAIIKNMFRPHANDHHYTVKYVKRAPATAEAWSQTKDYRNWKGMETRFAPYYGYNTREDHKHLKDVELPALKDEYRAGVQMVYDDLGVHLYVRADDPKVFEVNQGKRKGAYLEWVLSPGDRNAYHWFCFRGIPDSSDIYVVNWAGVTKNYRLTYDVIFKDSVVTEKGYAAHVFIPWIGMYDKLPAKDNVWRVGLQITNGDMRSLSGTVHELHRGVIMDFQFTEEQRIALERQICIQAFNRYNNIRRDDGGKIRNWNDIQLGDRVFYKKSLEEYIKELDEAGARLTAPAKDSEIHELFTKYVPQWAEILRILEDKRADYLLESLFEE